MRFVATAVLVVGLALGLWAFVLEPASLTTQHQTLRLPKWNRELSGLRIVVLADLHVGSPFNGISKLARIVELANQLRPDLILIPGDFVVDGVLGGTFVSPEEIAAILEQLEAPLGVWACLGNHDWWLEPVRVASALRAHGVQVLEDDAVRIETRDSHFWLVGLNDYWEGAPDIAKALRATGTGSPVLAFSHNPDVFPAVPASVSLLIAGHTHGGQVRLPFLGRPIIPSRYGQRYAHGHIVENGRHLYVSPGLGTSILPVRFRVPPEITVLELQRIALGAR